MADESVHLVYLDPPFKSNQDYNVLFQERNGTQSAAQIKAFEDTWSWSLDAEHAYKEVVEGGGLVSRFMQGTRSFLGENDMMAYLAMMAPRLVELRRVLKPTGSIYLHCDPTASAHLRLLMDSVFGVQNFRNEIIWKRTSAHADSRRWGHVQDVILYYAKSQEFRWNPQHGPHSDGYLRAFYRYEDPQRGKYRLDHIIRSATMGPRPNLAYEYKGYTPQWGWRVERAKLEALDVDGRLYWSSTGRPYLKRFLAEMDGVPFTSIWDDIRPIGAQAKERLGYPTQKPLALLERIIRASSNEGDVVLDPFCGCGTAVVAAQKLGRRWIGIDITHLAITLIKHRLKDTFPDKVIDEKEVKRGVEYDVIGEPADLAGAAALAIQDPIEFQRWAVGLVGASPREPKRGADRGIDGRLYFHDERDTRKTKQVIVQVKAGHVGVKDVRELMAVVEREKAQIGALISLQEPTRAMVTEAAAAGFYKWPWKEKDFPRMQLITVSQILRGKAVEYPHPTATSATFKRAPRAQGRNCAKQTNLGEA
jgi:DNA modification methylase